MEKAAVQSSAVEWNTSIDLRSVLQYELEHYFDTEDFQNYVDVTLETIHGNRNIGFFFWHAARGLAHHYAAVESRVDEEDHFAHMFYKGTVLGLHTTTSDLPDGVATKLHNFFKPNYYEELTSPKDGRDKSFNILEQLVEVHKWGHEAGDRKLITRAARHYAPDVDESLRYFFALGYRYSVEFICALCEVEYSDYEVAQT